MERMAFDFCCYQLLLGFDLMWMDALALEDPKWDEHEPALTNANQLYRLSK